ncbi:hypothetical protein AB0L06_07130 [Spirillospora sp. NPDC052269]
MRGPGPLLRWRGPVRLLEFERFRGTAYLRVKPTGGVQNSEYRTAKWTEPEDGLGLWETDRRDASMARSLPDAFRASPSTTSSPTMITWRRAGAQVARRRNVAR